MGDSGNPATQASPGLHDYRECSRRTGMMFTSGRRCTSSLTSFQLEQEWKFPGARLGSDPNAEGGRGLGAPVSVPLPHRQGCVCIIFFLSSRRLLSFV